MTNRFSPFFSLELNPFGETPDTYFFYESKIHSHVLTQLGQALKQGRGFALLTGEVGTGKTLITRKILNQLEPTFSTALILNSNFSANELLQSICEEFEIDFSRHSTQAPLGTWKYYLDHFYDFLLDNAKKGKQTVLIVDEAQNLDLKNLEAIRMLSNLETESKKLLQIVLVGQPELQLRLEHPNLRQLKQRIGIQLLLTPFQLAETESYIKFRLDRAGGANLVRFEMDALVLIHEISAGIPRNLNRICEKLLAQCQQSGVRLIQEAHVRESLKDTENIPHKFSRILKRLPYLGKSPI